MHLGEALREREADPEPSVDRLARPVPLPEHREDVREVRRRDPDAGIDDRNDDVSALPDGLEADAPVGLGVLGGVRKEVRQNLREPHRVRVQEHRRIGKDQLERVAAAA